MFFEFIYLFTIFFYFTIIFKTPKKIYNFISHTFFLKLNNFADLLIEFYSNYMAYGYSTMILLNIFPFSFILLITLSLSIEWKVINNAIPLGDNLLSSISHNFSTSDNSLFVAIRNAWNTCAIFFALSFWKHPTTASLN